MFLKIQLILLTIFFSGFINYSIALADTPPALFCLIESNCSTIELKSDDSKVSFDHLLVIASGIPRTTTLEENKLYWHGVTRSRVFGFPDDLEILSLPSNGMIQIKSSSRLGLFDFGVNRKRVKFLINKI